MEFRIADTFTASLARLSGDEQKSVKTTAFDLQLNPAQPSLQFHKLDKARDKNFWSIRVNSDIRLIVHRTGTSLLLCYVDHHNGAYQWAERRKLETHPKTGAAQVVEIRELIQEIQVPKYVDVAQPDPPKPRLFQNVLDGQFLAHGVPQEWLADVRNATEDSLLEIAGHLPAEAGEALLTLATGGMPATAAFVLKPPESRIRGLKFRVGGVLGDGPSPHLLKREYANSFEHPDALRRFRLIETPEELALALDYPWERWTVFLHPAQHRLVGKDFNGPARVAGSAGTGKTIVALHRAVHLARKNPDARVLLTTFSDVLANALRARLRLLISSEPRLGERIEVLAMNSLGLRLYERSIGNVQIASKETICKLIEGAAKATAENKFSIQFLLMEWEQVVDAWQLDTWKSYRDVVRLGRKTRLTEPQRTIIWSIFEKVRASLREIGQLTYSGLFNVLASRYTSGTPSPFNFAVVDEAQDVSIAQLRFLADLCANQPNALFFAGDLGQRIFQQPFSWKALGVDVRGRSTTLRINYRTSHQIRNQADRLLGPEMSDVDGNTEMRKGTISLFNGPKPLIQTFDSVSAEKEAVAEWIEARLGDGTQPHEIAIFVRTVAEIPRAKAAAETAGAAFQILDEHVDVLTGKVAIATMHLAKGLEFRAVAVMACDDEIIPSQARIETIADEGDLEDAYNTERQLLYVACTRARDHLLVSSVEPASEFLDDLQNETSTKPAHGTAEAV